MRYKRVNVDSLNLAGSNMESIFFYHEDYIIETVKGRGCNFNPKEWSKTFGKALKRSTIEAKIIHTHLGLKLPLKTFSRSPRSSTLEFAGLHGYNERSQLLVQTLHELKSQLQYTRVMRMDVAIDYKGKIPQSIIKALSKLREPFEYRNTTYYKTAKEKKTNPYMDIKIYNKQKQAKLDYPLNRLEFVFKSGYFNKLLLKDIETAYKKMEKSIKKAIGLTVKIEPI